MRINLPVAAATDCFKSSHPLHRARLDLLKGLKQQNPVTYKDLLVEHLVNLCSLQTVPKVRRQMMGYMYFYTETPEKVCYKRGSCISRDNLTSANQQLRSQQRTERKN